jgi:hypothetical protein
MRLEGESTRIDLLVQKGVKDKCIVGAWGKTERDHNSEILSLIRFYLPVKGRDAQRPSLSSSLPFLMDEQRLDLNNFFKIKRK